MAEPAPAEGHQPRRRRIAIDGPAASGKSAVGSAVARRLGFPFIDTGLIYRALTWLALCERIDPSDVDALTALAASAEIGLRPQTAGAPEISINGLNATPHLRSPEVEGAVSPVSAVAGVREHLIAIQRQLASGDAVMAGRDIGSVVLPDAEIKLYLDASPEERARRRQRQLEAAGAPGDYTALVAQMRQRDMLDSTRAVAPLLAAADAVRLITDGMSLPEVVADVLELAYHRWPELLPPGGRTPDERLQS